MAEQEIRLCQWVRARCYFQSIAIAVSACKNATEGKDKKGAHCDNPMRFAAGVEDAAVVVLCEIFTERAAGGSANG